MIGLVKAGCGVCRMLLYGIWILNGRIWIVLCLYDSNEMWCMVCIVCVVCCMLFSVICMALILHVFVVMAYHRPWRRPRVRVRS